jgi:hypothetical protein
MSGQVLDYESGTRRGDVLSETGIRLPFVTRENESGICAGAHVEFKVAEQNGDLVAVRVHALNQDRSVPIHASGTPDRAFAELAWA